jgi:Spy/CpxP family protein refolding chaperone
LKEQLKLSSDDHSLRRTIQGLNEQLAKQVSLTRLQAEQILEFEQSLWQANKQREEAVDKLYDLQNGLSAPTPDSVDYQQELRAKAVQIRELQSQVSTYQGKATSINAFSQHQLTDLHDELQQSTNRVSIALANTVKK